MKYQIVPSRKTILIILAVVSACFPALAGEREEYTFAFKLFQDEKYIFAKDQFKVYLTNYPRSEHADDARFLAGECALRLDNYEEAIQHYKKLVIDYPAYEEAIKAYEEVIGQSKDPLALSQSLYLVGESFDNLGLYQKAVEYYNRLLAEFPKSAEAKDALYGKGWGLFRLKEYQEAYKTLSQFVASSPTHPALVEASYRAAESLFKLGNWADAQIRYRNMIDSYQ